MFHTAIITINFMTDTNIEDPTQTLRHMQTLIHKHETPNSVVVFNSTSALLLGHYSHYMDGLFTVALNNPCNNIENKLGFGTKAK